MTISQSYKEKTSQMADLMGNCSRLLNSESTTAGNIAYTGLGMEAESKLLNNLSDDLRKGIFKILAMGEFKNGKSTLLNAVIGNKVLPAKDIATTAIITILVYGKNTSRALVYLKDNPAPVEMTIQEFNEEYRLTPEDEQLIYDGNAVDRFLNVEYALIECDSRFCENGVRLIDSPGLGEADARNKTTMKYVPSANAIIFVQDATHLLSLGEKKYIRENFAGKGLRNIFFVVNRINQVTEGLDEVKEAEKHYLKGIFTDSKGVFDEDLYNSRVFFVNAYGALEAKQNNRADLLKSTDYERFEEALKQFLISDDKATAAFQSSMAALANIYMKSELVVDEYKNALKLPLEILEKKYEVSQNTLMEAEQELKKVHKAFKRTADIVKAKVYESLWNYIDTMESSWEADAEKIDHKLDLSDVVKLALTRNAEKRNDIIAPLSEELKNYINDKLDAWGAAQELLIEPEIKSLMEEINYSAQKIDFQIQKSSKIFSGVIGENENFISSEVNGGQLIISLLLFDPSMLISGAAEGGFSWGEFFKKTVVQYIIRWIIFGLFTGGFAWLVFIASEIAHVKLETENLNDRVLAMIKKDLFSKLRESITIKRSELEKTIQDEFEIQKNKVTQALETVIRDEKNRQNNILEQKKNTQENIGNKISEYMKAREMLFENIAEIYSVIYNRDLDIDELKNLSGNS